MTPRPATRVDNWVLFPGGLSRPLTLRERLRLWLDPEALISWR